MFCRTCILAELCPLHRCMSVFSSHIESSCWRYIACYQPLIKFFAAVDVMRLGTTVQGLKIKASEQAEFGSNKQIPISQSALCRGRTKLLCAYRSGSSVFILGFPVATADWRRSEALNDIRVNSCPLSVPLPTFPCESQWKQKGSLIPKILKIGITTERGTFWHKTIESEGGAVFNVIIFWHETLNFSK